MPANIVEFATDHLKLTLFPRQATFLKIATLEVELLTEFDRKVIAEWTSGFEVEADGDDLSYAGRWGTPPDLEQRMQWCRDHDRRWFSEIVLVLGRRGSKNYLAAILVAWQLWRLLCLGNPQAHYGITPTKTIAVYEFGTDQATLQRNAHQDIAGLIETAPCFAPYRGKTTTEMITLLTPAQLGAGATPHVTRGYLAVVAAATTFTAGRGPAVTGLLFDEFAFVQGAGSTATSSDIYQAATPATMQFGGDRLVIQASSPSAKTGQHYDSYQRGLQIDPTTGTARDPATLVLQLPSWDLYLHDEAAGSIPMWPNGPTFTDQKAIITEAMVKAMEDRGDDVSVEYHAQFASSPRAYLHPDRVAAIFGTWNGATLEHQARGLLGRDYVAHADPSKSNANFAFAIGHLEPGADDRPHTVYDLLRVWKPSDFAGGIIDYTIVEEQIFRFIEAFRIRDTTFDQYSSTQSIQQLNQRAQAAGLAWRPVIHELTATAALNFKAAEVFKTTVYEGRVHAPHHDLARSELEYLQEYNGKVRHPDTGPVTTDDLADAMIMVNYKLQYLRDDETFKRLGGGPRATMPDGYLSRDPIADLSNFGQARRRPTGPHPARGRGR
jgi:hypothetical protein